jgi:class 3 adenylate cyclase
VFKDPSDAISTCLDAQQRLASTKWPLRSDVRVGICIHCGLVAPRNNHYMALAVHQAARVMSAANGGQILVTNAILQRLDPLEGVTVGRAGRYRLPDFDQPPRTIK